LSNNNEKHLMKKSILSSSQTILPTFNKKYYIKQKEKNVYDNKNETEKKFLCNNIGINDSKTNKSIYGYMDDNKDFYIGSNFSKKYKKLFELENKSKRHVELYINKKHIK